VSSDFHIKREIRILAIDDSALLNKKVMIIGTLFRGGDWMDGVQRKSMTAYVEFSGKTHKIEFSGKMLQNIETESNIEEYGYINSEKKGKVKIQEQESKKV